MMRVAEDGLGVGDYLPDFALEDAAGRTWTSGELLDRGPLVLALFRGDWCPYCDLTMVALEEARPAIEALGATAVGVMPDRREHIARTAARRNIGYLLLSDPANGFARTCGLAYDLSPGHIRIHKERGRDFARPARRHDLAPAGAGGVRRRAERARGLCLHRRRSRALARSRGAARLARRGCAMPTRYRIGRHSAFQARARGAQGAITNADAQGDRTCFRARPPSSPAPRAASDSASPRPSPAPAPTSC